MILKCGRTVNPGIAEGEALVTKTPFSFLGELDPSTGRIPIVGHELEDQIVAGKILICPTGKGSSAGPNIAYLAKKVGNAPIAVICVEVEPILALAAITADIPAVDRLDQNPLEVIKTGDWVRVDATQGVVTVIENP
jgi:predicted aconitase with swiveling domain